MKKKIEKILKERIESLEDYLESSKNSLLILSNLNMEKISFDIIIESHWTEHGGKGFEMKVRGTLRKAIEETLSKIKSNGEDSYISSVSMRIGEEDLRVPEELWKKYDKE